MSQPATGRISLDFALAQGTGTGTRIAILDTGVDPDHPLLAGVLLPGRDFVNDRSGTASEWIDVAANVQQAFQAGAAGDLSQSTVAILWQSTVAILWQSTVAILWGEPAPAARRPC